MTTSLKTQMPAKIIPATPIQRVSETNLGEAKIVNPNRAFILTKNFGLAKDQEAPPPPTQMIDPTMKKSWKFFGRNRLIMAFNEDRRGL